LLLVSLLSLVAIIVATPALANQLASDTVSEDQPAAAISVPAALPTSRGSDGAYGFMSIDALARLVGGGSTPSSGGNVANSGDASSASITVTATVLPVRTIVVSANGTLKEIWSNTNDLDGRHSLYIVRVGTSSGSTTTLDSGLWAEVRAALRSADEPTGRVY
jgi:hypothetical protein